MWTQKRKEGGRREKKKGRGGFYGNLAAIIWGSFPFPLSSPAGQPDFETAAVKSFPPPLPFLSPAAKECLSCAERFERGKEEGKSAQHHFWQKKKDRS